MGTYVNDVHYTSEIVYGQGHLSSANSIATDNWNNKAGNLVLESQCSIVNLTNFDMDLYFNEPRYTIRYRIDIKEPGGTVDTTDYMPIAKHITLPAGSEPQKIGDAQLVVQPIHDYDRVMSILEGFYYKPQVTTSYYWLGGEALRINCQYKDRFNGYNLNHERTLFVGSMPRMAGVKAPASIDFGKVMVGTVKRLDLPLDIWSLGPSSPTLSFRAENITDDTRGTLGGATYQIMLPNGMGGRAASLTGADGLKMNLTGDTVRIDTQIVLTTPPTVEPGSYSTNLTINVKLP